jgi:hypothetical protein
VRAGALIRARQCRFVRAGVDSSFCGLRPLVTEGRGDFIPDVLTPAHLVSAWHERRERQRAAQFFAVPITTFLPKDNPMNAVRRSWASAAQFSALAIAVTLGSASAVLANNVTYNWNNYTAGQSGWIISGSMTVSQLGTITEDKILSYSRTATSGTTSFGGSGDWTSAPLATSGTGTAYLDATLTSLNLPNETSFSLYSNPYVGSLNWRNNLYGSSDYYAATSGGGPQFRSSAYSPMKGSAWTIGTNAAPSAPSSVPEIDPATGGSALSLVGGALAFGKLGTGATFAERPRNWLPARYSR